MDGDSADAHEMERGESVTSHLGRIVKVNTYELKICPEPYWHFQSLEAESGFLNVLSKENVFPFSMVFWRMWWENDLMHSL